MSPVFISKRLTRWLALVVAIFAGTPVSACGGRTVEDVRAVSYDTLAALAATDSDWLTYAGTYNGRRFSALTQINQQTVGALKPLWTHPISEQHPIETTPLVVDGGMFFTKPPN